MTRAGPRVVAGYDGSTHADPALRWAAHEAARRGVRLEVLTVVDDVGLGVHHGPVGVADWWPKAAARGALRIAHRGVDVACDEEPGLDARPVGRAGLPVAALVHASAGAELLVLGTRGRNPVVEMALGSVAERCATHAHCPVAVVHRDVATRPGADGPVVVGVDGSPGSRRAVDVAAGWARRTCAPLTVVCVWSVGAAWQYDVLTAPETSALEQAAADAARSVADDAGARALECHPELQVAAIALPGEPAQVLTRRAAGAGLLVVGSRGLGGFAGLVLGSVSHAVVRTAPCAVLVVGPETQADDQPVAVAVTRLAWNG